MSAIVIDNLLEQIKTLRLHQQIAIGEAVSQITNDIEQMETQLQQYIDAHNRQAQAIGELKTTLLAYRHLAAKSQECIEQLVQRLRYRAPDDLKAYPGDRAALLDADLVLAQIYKTFQAEQA
jgi:Mg2+ and Co2+ transporter CorA